MSDTTVTTEEPAADPANDAAATPAPAGILSQGQTLLNRYKAQFDRLMAAHRRLAGVKGAVTAKPAATVSDAPPASERPTPFFTGLTMIADANDTALTAIEADIEDLARLF